MGAINVLVPLVLLIGGVVGFSVLLYLIVDWLESLYGQEEEPHNPPPPPGRGHG